MAKCPYYRSQLEKWMSKEVDETLRDADRIKKSLNEWCEHPDSPKTKDEMGKLACQGVKEECTIKNR